MLESEVTFDLAEIIRAARGEKRVDLLIRNARIVNVLSGEIYLTNVAIDGGLIVGFGDYQAIQNIDLEGKYLAPGFLDGHMHMESSMIEPTEFSRVVVPKGTTTVIVDPHEIANVRGIEGIKYILRANKVVPLDIYAMVPSCVPATPLETSGAKLTAEDIVPSFTKDRVLGLGELMDFPGVLNKNPHVLRKMKVKGIRRIDGHAPGLSGKDLYAYVAAGAVSDHECTTFEEALEKLRLGMYIMIREGSVTRDLDALLPLVTPVNMRRCMFVTDDREPLDLVNEGHMSFVIKKAISRGMDPTVAFAMATINTAEYFGLKNIGAIAPGYIADLVVIDNFNDFNVSMVFKKGHLVAKDGKPLFALRSLDATPVMNTVNIPPIDPDTFKIEAKGEYINVIGLVPQQIITRKLKMKTKIEDGYAVSDPENDILKMVVIERHNATGNIGKSFATGFGIKKGALASTVAHDSHNLLILGANDNDMAIAAKRIQELQGGQVIVVDGKVVAELPLPIGGLMSDLPLHEVKERLDKFDEITAELGSGMPHPFMTLSFMALPVIPELKVTDLGLVDVNKFEIIDIFDT
ncbi:MAG: adenine deaminase [Candidatus Eremiobacteraeota bacterium]|nr:adenine deaminase [Candidatus Eremiobacteraeota bacterium]